MKNRFKNRFSLTEMLLCIAVLGLLAALALPASAQVTAVTSPRVYLLTNSTSLNNTAAITNMAAGALTTVNSQPFPLKPGRGFAVQLSIIGTNANTALVTPYFQFATPIYIGSTLTTNWSTGQTLAGPTATANGTTRVYSFGIVPATSVDHAVLGRLSSLSNAHSAGTQIEFTNSFVIIQ